MIVLAVVLGWLICSAIGLYLFYKSESYIPVAAVIMSVLGGPFMVIIEVILAITDTGFWNKDITGWFTNGK